MNKNSGLNITDYKIFALMRLYKEKNLIEK